jgi:hypothetical protein
MTTRNKQDGGSAFPVWDSNSMHRIGMAASQDIEDASEREREYIRATAEAAQGMTLRDHFAGLAMQAYLSGQDRDEFGYGDWAEAPLTWPTP